jgi:hypothetical protein
MTQAVECVDLSYQFATHLAVDHVNLSIAPGEMYGPLGPNGAARPPRSGARINPLSYEVEALRGLLIGTTTTLWLDTVVLVGATIVSITCAALLLPRLANR